MDTVDTQEAEKIVEDSNSVVIDALGPESFEKQHLPGAINIPADDPDFDAKAEKYIPAKDTTVMVYCLDEDCRASPKAYRRLDELGYTDLHEFSGGLEAWAKAGHRMEGEGKERIEADIER